MTRILDHPRKQRERFRDGHSWTSESSTPNSGQAGAPSTDEREGLAVLVRRLGEGDESALAAFYDATSGWVFGIVFRILSDTQSAEEATLDVYLQAWNTSREYSEQRGSVLAWLTMIARSRAIDRFRSRERHQREVPLTADSVGAAEVATPPENELLSGERRERIRGALDELPAEQRNAIELAFFQGLTHEQISASLRLPIGTIKTRIRLAVLRLRGLLQPSLLEEN